MNEPTGGQQRECVGGEGRAERVTSVKLGM